MSTLDREARLNRLLEQAIDLPEDQWRPFLERAAEDPDLACEAEALLRGEPGLDDFLDSPALAMDDADEGSSTIGTQIGAYTLVEVLGRGGMGTVFLAEQRDPIERHVALKVIDRPRFSEMDRRRFEVERRALARLSHPNIAQLYEAGNDPSGTPYFAMEWVDGKPLTTHCDATVIDLEGRLQLFRRVCSGLAHAHRKGILHRDLKPSNILVTEIDGRSVPKIIDFGIAKALDGPLIQRTLETGQHLIGTPAYMSPEAAESGHLVDTRSDVYALGVMLYELLVGVRPLDSGEDHAIRLLRRIAEEDPPHPTERWRALDSDRRGRLLDRRRTSERELLTWLGGDLGAVLMKAIARRPADRYGSVGELDADLERVQRDEPVEAGRPSFQGQVARFARRHRGAVVASLLVLLALLVGLVGTSLGFSRARAEAESAQRALVESREVTELLVGMLEEADAQSRRRKELTVVELLHAGAERAQKNLQDHPEARARVLTTIGRGFTSLAEYGAAEGVMREVLTLRTESQGGDVEVWAWASIGMLSPLLGQRKFDEAEQRINEVTAALDAGRLDSPEIRAILDMELGLILRVTQRFDEAEVHIRRAIDYFESQGPSQEKRLAKSYSRLSNLQQNLGNYRDAEDSLRLSIALYEGLYGSDNAMVALQVHNLGTVLRRQGRNDEAIEAHQRALTIREVAYGPNHSFVASSLNSLAAVQIQAKRPEAAEEYLRRALEIRLAEDGPDHPKVALIWTNLSSVASSSGRYDEALGHIEEALRIDRLAYGPDHPRVALGLANLGIIQDGLGRSDAAASTLEQSLAMFEKDLGLGHPSLAEVLYELGKVEAGRGRPSQAGLHWTRALGILQKPQAASPSMVADIEAALAQL